MKKILTVLFVLLVVGSLKVNAGDDARLGNFLVLKMGRAMINARMAIDKAKSKGHEEKVDQLQRRIQKKIMHMIEKSEHLSEKQLRHISLLSVILAEHQDEIDLINDLVKEQNYHTVKSHYNVFRRKVLKEFRAAPKGGFDT